MTVSLAFAWPLCPCELGPDTSYFSTSTHGTISRVRGRATSGRQVVWGRAAAGGQVRRELVGAKGPGAGGGPWVHSCTAAGGGPGTEPRWREGGLYRVGRSSGRLQDGWGPEEGVLPAASATLRACASLFLGINIYRFICRLPYTLGCLPSGKNSAGSSTPACLFLSKTGTKEPGEACYPAASHAVTEPCRWSAQRLSRMGCDPEPYC